MSTAHYLTEGTNEEARHSSFVHLRWAIEDATRWVGSGAMTAEEAAPILEAIEKLKAAAKAEG